MAQSERFEMLLNTTHTLMYDFGELAGSGDTVIINIYDVEDANLDIDGASMTFVRGGSFKYSWSAPNQTNLYQVEFHNQTLNITYTVFIKLTGSITGSPSGSTEGDTLSVLRKEFLISTVDAYNADEGTGDGTNNDVARRCINQAAQKIYSILRDSKFTDSNPSTLLSVASQAYIELSGISDLDEILSMYEGTNDIRLVKKPIWWIRENYPDQSETEGTPLFYARLFNRIYLTPIPASAITYNVDYKKNIGNMTSDSDRVGIPAKFNFWLFAEAHVFWQKNDDPRDVNTIRELRSIALELQQIAINDALDGFDEIMQSESHFTRDEKRGEIYDSPIGS